MARVLVAYGSKMGGTAGIAQRIADTLRGRGMDVSLRPAGEVGGVDDYDAILVGSAIYTGRWHPEAVRLVHRIADAGVQSPVWLFHSGPLDVEGTLEAQPLPRSVTRWTDRLNMQEVKTFGGRLPADPKGFVARAMAKTMAGDWRNLPAVAVWAEGVADTLGDVVT